MLSTRSTRVETLPGGFDVCQITRPDSPSSSLREVSIVRPDIQTWREEITPNSEGGRHQWKSFEHYKCSSSGGTPQGLHISADMIDNYYLHEGEYRQQWGLYSNEYGQAGETNSGLPLFYEKRQDGGFVPPPANLNDLIRSSLGIMIPRIKAELSLINSIIELKDFRSLPGTLNRARHFMFGSLSTINRRIAMRQFVQNATLRTIARSASGNYLGLRFNYLSLISDIQNFYKALKQTEKRINAFITRAGRVRISHYIRNLTESTDPEPTTIQRGGFHCYENGSEYHLGSVLKTVRNVYTAPSVFHAQLQYNYNYTAYQREHARMLSLLDSVGVNLNPAIIWNAIPWTFVVDWLIGVSRWLSEQRTGWMDPQINMLQYLWSIKRQRQIILTTTCSSDIYYSGSGMQGTYPSSIVRPIVQETSYRRSVGLPDVSSFTTSGLSLDEISLGAALVVSRGRHSHRR